MIYWNLFIAAKVFLNDNGNCMELYTNFKIRAAPWPTLIFLQIYNYIFEAFIEP